MALSSDLVKAISGRFATAPMDRQFKKEIWYSRYLLTKTMQHESMA